MSERRPKREKRRRVTRPSMRASPWDPSPRDAMVLRAGKACTRRGAEEQELAQAVDPKLGEQRGAHRPHARSTRADPRARSARDPRSGAAPDLGGFAHRTCRARSNSAWAGFPRGEKPRSSSAAPGARQHQTTGRRSECVAPGLLERASTPRRNALQFLVGRPRDATARARLARRRDPDAGHQRAHPVLESHHGDDRRADDPVANSLSLAHPVLPPRHRANKSARRSRAGSRTRCRPPRRPSAPA